MAASGGRVRAEDDAEATTAAEAGEDGVKSLATPASELGLTLFS